MGRTVVAVVLLVAGLELVPAPIPVSAGVRSAGLPGSPAFVPPGHITRAAGGVWDPDDVEGPVDLRWVGAAYTSAGEIHLSVSFYEGFDWRVLPGCGRDRGVRYVDVWLSAALEGLFFCRRPGGRIVFLWGDMASSCCAKARATRPSSNVLSVTFDPCSYIYGEEIEKAQANSLWRTRKVRAEDWTGEVPLRHPDCDTGT